MMGSNTNVTKLENTSTKEINFNVNIRIERPEITNIGYGKELERLSNLTKNLSIKRLLSYIGFIIRAEKGGKQN